MAPILYLIDESPIITHRHKIVVVDSVVLVLDDVLLTHLFLVTVWKLAKRIKSGFVLVLTATSICICQSITLNFTLNLSDKMNYAGLDDCFSDSSTSLCLFGPVQFNRCRR